VSSPVVQNQVRGFISVLFSQNGENPTIGKRKRDPLGRSRKLMRVEVLAKLVESLRHFLALALPFHGECTWLPLTSRYQSVVSSCLKLRTMARSDVTHVGRVGRLAQLGRILQAQRTHNIPASDGSMRGPRRA
jgi:hypothetical protein